MLLSPKSNNVLICNGVNLVLTCDEGVLVSIVRCPRSVLMLFRLQITWWTCWCLYSLTCFKWRGKGDGTLAFEGG